MKINKRGSIAISQIIILLISIIAFSYLVSAQGEPSATISLAQARTLYGTIPEGTTHVSTKTEFGEAGNWLKETSEGWSQYDLKTGKWESAGKGVPQNVAPLKQTGPEPGGDWLGTAKGFVGGIIQNAMYAGVVYGLVYFIGNMVSDDEQAVNAAATAAAAGVFAGKSAYDIANWWNEGWASEPGWFGISKGGWVGGAVGLVVFFLILYSQYEKEKEVTVLFECQPWEAPTGGDYCEECNEDPFKPCSQYRCKSLGQACEVVNQGTENEQCVWQHPDDVNPPRIRLWEDVLTEGLKYDPINAERPADEGVEIVRQGTDKCLEPFRPITFGIKTDEPAQCKVSYKEPETYDDLEYYFGSNNMYVYNHSQSLILPRANSSGPTLGPEGIYSLYLKCQDANGNYNVGNFIFRFCVAEGPDTTPPQIVKTNPINNMPISYNQDNVDVEVYTNEPADCKWSTTDQSYENMENQMTCQNNVIEVNAELLYKCETNLNGLKNEQNNVFYFKCKDQPNAPEEDRFSMAQSYEYTLIGTKPLVIKSIKPNNTIRDSVSPVNFTLEVETSYGYNDGEADCYYSETGDENDYILFASDAESDSHLHTQRLRRDEGSYTYFVKCIDLGGNEARNSTSFRINIETEQPTITRAYKDGDNLKIITNKEADCVYSETSCDYNFNEGVGMTSARDKIEHYTDWDIRKNYYIKCKDKWGNKPSPTQCSIMVKPYEMYED